MRTRWLRQHEMDEIAELFGYARGACSLVVRYPSGIYVRYIAFEPNPGWSWS